jgi:hypothetical protein
VGQVIHSHDLLWQYGAHGLMPWPQKIQAMDWLVQAIHLYDFLWPYMAT